MIDKYIKGRAIAKIVLSDNTEIEVKSKVIGDIGLTNYIDSGSIRESESASTNNPIGVPCSADGSLNIKTLDQSLMPENTKSPYYGLMNNEAVLYMLIEDSEATEAPLILGVYYIDNWYSTLSYDDTKTVILEFTGIMSALNKAMMPTLNIEKNVLFKDYLINLISKWNESADDKHKITIDESKLTFGPFTHMPFSDIDAKNIGEALTILSQSTLTNIYISGENELLTDYCFDDSASEAVGLISDCVNAVKYNVTDGLLVKYKGVKVNYPSIIVNSPSSISSLSGQTLKAGAETEINNIDTGGKLFKLNYVKVNSDEDDVVDIVDITYNKKEANIKLQNNDTKDLSVDIELIGQTINSNNMSFSSGSEPILEVTNNLLSQSDANKFMQNLNKVIHDKGNEISVSGYFNPRIKLGSIVNVELKAINKSGVYKVKAREISVGSSIKTTLTLSSLIVP